MITLDIQARDISVSSEQLRANGLMPAVFYGKGMPSTPISIVQKEFVKVWKEAGESSVVTLKGLKSPVDVLIHQVDFDPIKSTPIHADFYVFEKGKKIEVSVPLTFVGISPAVKDLGGNLMKVLREIKISADPQHIPHEIEVDITVLKTFEDQITASEIKLPSGVDLEENPEEVVVFAEEAKEVVEEVSAPVDLSAIEVEKKGKKEEEEEAA